MDANDPVLCLCCVFRAAVCQELRCRRQWRPRPGESRRRPAYLVTPEVSRKGILEDTMCV